MSGTVSQRAYALSRGVTAGAIWQAIQAGRIPTDASGRINPAEADAAWFERRQQRVAETKASAEANARIDQAALMATLARLQVVRRRHQRLRTELVERDKPLRTVSALVAALLDALGRMVQQGGLEGESAELALADLADLQTEAERALAVE